MARARELPEGADFISTYMTKEDLEVLERAQKHFGEKRNTALRRIIQEWAKANAQAL